jgi:hypothetical protein
MPGHKQRPVSPVFFFDYNVTSDGPTRAETKASKCPKQEVDDGNLTFVVACSTAVDYAVSDFRNECIDLVA